MPNRIVLTINVTAWSLKERKLHLLKYHLQKTLGKESASSRLQIRENLRTSAVMNGYVNSILISSLLSLLPVSSLLSLLRVSSLPSLLPVSSLPSLLRVSLLLSLLRVSSLPLPFLSLLFLLYILHRNNRKFKKNQHK